MPHVPDMSDPALVLLTLGAVFLLGLAADALGRHTPLPRVTLLLVAGIAVGPSALDLLPELSNYWFPIVANMALVMVGFLLGERLVHGLRAHRREVLTVSVVEVIVTAIVVAAVLLLAGVPVAIALLLAGLAPATAPAATLDVLRESGARGPMVETLLGVVALDDAWGILAFGLFLAVAEAWAGADSAAQGLVYGVGHLVGGGLVGLVLGVPAAYMTGRIRKGEPMLVEALGLVFVCGGVALWLDVSYLLAAMTLGAVVARLAEHHERPFHAIEEIEWPFMVLFFLLAGASLEVASIRELGVVGGAYILARAAGKILGAWTGARAASAPVETRRWLGLALMPQAGVALGLALVASQRLPEVGDRVLPVAIGATVVFELIGPVLSRLALRLSGSLPGPG
ncbi:MAG: cation:proton antiporter [Myxococcota bacterium]